jgi:hypothetical protein
VRALRNPGTHIYGDKDCDVFDRSVDIKYMKRWDGPATINVAVDVERCSVSFAVSFESDSVRLSFANVFGAEHFSDGGRDLCDWFPVIIMLEDGIATVSTLDDE